MKMKSNLTISIIFICCLSLLQCNHIDKPVQTNKETLMDIRVGTCEALIDFQPTPVDIAIGIDEETIYYLTQIKPTLYANKIIAYNTVQKTIKWEYVCDSIISQRSIMVKENTIIFGSYNLPIETSEQYIYAIDTLTGAQRWKFKNNRILHKNSFLWEDHCIYAPSLAFQVIAINDKDGTLIWKKDMYEINPKDRQVKRESVDDLAIEGDHLFVNTNKIRVLDTKTGSDLWSYLNPPFGSGKADLIVADKILLAVSGNTIYAFSTRSNNLLWEYPAPFSIIYNYFFNQDRPLLVYHQSVVFWSRGFIGLDISTGKEIWAQKDAILEKPRISTFVMMNGSLFYIIEKDTSHLQPDTIPMEETAILEAIQMETGNRLGTWRLVTKDANQKNGIHFDSLYGLRKLGNDFYFKGYTNTKGDNQMYKDDYEFLYRVPVPDISKFRKPES